MGCQGNDIYAKNPNLMKKYAQRLPFYATIPILASIILNSTQKKYIQKIYLFGSYAYGKPTKKSDIDIAVILDNDANRHKIGGEIIGALFDNKILRNDFIPYMEEEFYHNDNPLSIENTIREKGILLYER